MPGVRFHSSLRPIFNYTRYAESVHMIKVGESKTMHHQIEIDGRSVKVELSARAMNSLYLRTKPLLAEMELYFSCLVRKKVRFHERPQESDHVKVSDRLVVRFRPVMTESCHIGDFDDEPPVTDFPIANPKAFVPHWLRIDCRDGRWQGEFGYL
jgi:hypothetical protein